MRAQLPRQLMALTASLTLTATWLGGGTAHAQDSFDALTDEDQAKIDRGEIVVRVERTHSPLKGFMAVGLVEAPASKVYRAYTDFERYPEIFNLKDSKVTRKDDFTYSVRAILSVPWPIGERWVTNETRLTSSTYSFVYKRAEGSILEYTGSLKVVPKGPGLSQVYYVAKVDPGIPFVPAWLVNRFQEGMLPSSIQAVRDYLKRNQDRY